ncbi:hypothetical protein HW932_00235 [Allochromatium humboldtianum]|uniref:DUF5681 domain-containing protein n=1 Tax=Allochromatium humboldtianum TaxID=504901 RepID=A0A850R4E7_9GAMM|nr:DUF5681 domain-containing protein [Allochromatium humboldtianum]NVZ07685.1 hypothetical protein [Allochromatium humboldtianum]
MPEPPTNHQRDANGKFVPGASGNPKGRKPGSGSSPGVRLRRLIAQHGDELVRALIKQAKQGDTVAAVALLDRCVARLRPMSEPVSIDVTGDRQAVADRLLQAVSAGELSTETASELLALVGSARPPDTSITPIDFDKLDELYNKAMQASDAEAARIEAERLAGLRG